jgi:hypothetical protein
MRSRFFVPFILLLAFLPAAFAQTQLIQNGGFESGYAPWVLAGSGITIASGTNLNGGYPYDGALYLSMGNFPGATQYAYQTVTFPTNLIGATLSLYYQTVSTDPNGDDALTFYILDTNQNVLFNLGTTYSSDRTGGYVHAVTNLATYQGSNTLSSLAGQTVEVYFYVTTDSTYGSSTSFDIDDVSLLAGTPANIPSNDSFTNATPIPAVGITNAVNTVYASKEPGEPNHAGNTGGHSVWWTWTAPAIGTVTINTTGSSFDTLLAVYTNSTVTNVALTNLTCVISNNGATRASGLASLKFTVPTPAQVGATYYIALDGYNGQAGNAVFNFAFSPDTTPPSVAISSPANQAVVASSTVLVTGTANDNVAVASVQYTLANAHGTNAWQLATTTNQWTNWSATVTNLIPGTNKVTVEAFDTRTNRSVLVSHLFNYEITAPLALFTIGGGTISGATNGQLLVLGFSYQITAKTNGGFAFAGWTGSIVTNSATLSFIMTTNLSFTANFVDVTPPSLTITAPTASQRWSNSTFTATGTAKDNVQVSNVFYQLNGGNWRLATPGNSAWTNWTVTLTPLESTNLFLAYAVDTSGNKSPTNKITFFYIPSAMLTVRTNGNGGITPVDNGKLLAIGTNYTLTAAPGNNWLFSNWVASGGENFVSNNPVLKFTMQSNLFLQANFVTNLFLAAQGAYHGLFAPAGVMRQQTNSGSFALNLTSTGAFTGDFFLGSNTVSLNGQFDVSGHVQTSSAVKGGKPLTTILQLDVSNQTISGTVSDGSFVAQLDGDLNVFGPSHPAAEYAGQYTWTIPGTDDWLVGPYGVSYGTLTVSASGDIALAGNLADGTTVSQSSAVSQDGRWPMYLPSSNPNESLFGWIYFTHQTLTAPAFVSWINVANQAKAAVYPSGFTNRQAAVIASIYNSADKPLLSLTSAQVILAEGNLPFNITNQITLASNNTITVPHTAANTNGLTLKITPNTGLITGSFQNPANPKQTITINGVLLQNQTNAQGYFLGTNQSGAFLLENP